MENLIKVQDTSIVKKRDPLDTKVIPGASPDTYGRLKFIKGRDYINTTDIEGAQR